MPLFVSEPTGTSPLLPQRAEAPSWSWFQRIGIPALLVFLVLVAVSILDLRGADHSIVHLFNSLSRRFALFDFVVRMLTRDMFSTLVVMCLVWFTWMQRTDLPTRAGILAGVVTAFLSGIVSRGLQLLLPSHPRPLHDPLLHFRIPFGVDPDTLNHWASFPSDHAAVLFGLAMTILMANRSVGSLAMAVAFSANVARIYLGYHYPSDVASGAALGIFSVSATWNLRRFAPALRLAQTAQTRAPLFYAVGLFLSFGISTLFIDVRDTASDLLHGVHIQATGTAAPSHQTARPASEPTLSDH